MEGNFFIDRRILTWGDPSRDIPLLPYLLSEEEGPLIAKDLTLEFRENGSITWPSGNINLVDFLHQCGDWFSKLELTTKSHSSLNDIDYPMSSDRIEQIRIASRISTIIIRARDITPFIPLIQEPHVRRLELIVTYISQSTIDLLRRHHWDDLFFHNCEFGPGVLKVLLEHPLSTLRVEQFIHSPEQVSILREFSSIQAISLSSLFGNSSVIRETFSSTLGTFTCLQKLSLPYLTLSENEVVDLSNLTTLTSLEICDGPGDHLITAVSKLPKLRSLHFGSKFTTKMTPAHCDSIIRGCPLLEELTWGYGGNYVFFSNLIRLPEMTRIVTEMKHLRHLTQRLVSIMYLVEIKEFLSHHTISPSIMSVAMDSRNLLDECNPDLPFKRDQYFYTVFVLIRAWMQRIGSMIVLPKDIVNLILTEHAPFLKRSPSAVHEMVKFMWTNWQQIEQLVHAKTIFKVVQSRSGEDVKLVGLSQDKRWEVIP